MPTLLFDLERWLTGQLAHDVELLPETYLAPSPGRAHSFGENVRA